MPQAEASATEARLHGIERVAGLRRRGNESPRLHGSDRMEDVAADFVVEWQLIPLPSSQGESAEGEAPTVRLTELFG